MKHLRTHPVRATASHVPSQAVSKSNRTGTIRFPASPTLPGEPIDHCYRALLEASNSAILLLSPESIILGWNRAAETLSGWMADAALGRSYVELCLPKEAREPFLAELARVATGIESRGFESPLQSRTRSQTMLSWNISCVLETHGHLTGLMAIGTAVAPHTQAEEKLRLAHARIRSEARRAQTVAKEERRRIARELHDEFGQALTGLEFDLAWCGMKLTQSPAPTGDKDLLNKVQAMSGSVDVLLESVRATAAALRPAMLDDLGLVPALECLATAFHRRTGAECALDVAPGVVIRSTLVRSVYRVVPDRTGIADECNASRRRLAHTHTVVPERWLSNVRSDRQWEGHHPGEDDPASFLWPSWNAGTSLSAGRPLSYRRNVRGRNHGLRLHTGRGVLHQVNGTRD